MATTTPAKVGSSNPLESKEGPVVGSVPMGVASLVPFRPVAPRRKGPSHSGANTFDSSASPLVSKGLHGLFSMGSATESSALPTGATDQRTVGLAAHIEGGVPFTSQSTSRRATYPTECSGQNLAGFSSTDDDDDYDDDEYSRHSYSVPVPRSNAALSFNATSSEAAAQETYFHAPSALRPRMEGDELPWAREMDSFGHDDAKIALLESPMNLTKTRSAMPGTSHNGSAVVSPRSMPECTSAAPGALEEPAIPESPLVYNPILDEYAYVKLCLTFLAARLMKRIARIIDIAARFVEQRGDLTGSAATEIRMLGEVPSMWPTSNAVVASLRWRVELIDRALKEVPRAAIFGPAAMAAWSGALGVLRAHATMIPMCLAVNKATHMLGQTPPLNYLTVAWCRVTVPSNIAVTSPIALHQQHHDDDDEWSDSEESQDDKDKKPLHVAVDEEDEWTDTETPPKAAGPASVTQSISCDPTPTNIGKKWTGSAAEFLDLDLRRFSARREARLKCAPLPQLSLTLGSLVAQDNDRSRSFAADSSSSSFATCGHIGMDEVLPGLFCGSREPSEDMIHLDLNHVTHVVSCINTSPFIGTHISYTVLDLLDVDEQPLLPQADLCATVAVKERCIEGGENVLVHCGSGVSRAPAVMIVSLCRLYPELSSSSIGAVLRHGRPYVLMNNGFKRQLCDLFPDLTPASQSRTTSRASGPRSISSPHVH